jgi:alanine dehydrogenase
MVYNRADSADKSLLTGLKEVNQMRIGIPREIKNNENRVALTPACVQDLTRLGHTVVVEEGAGLGSGFGDDEFLSAGAVIGSISDCWKCGLVVKVKEPQPQEYCYFRPDLILFTYLHLAAAPRLAEEIDRTGLKAIAYETVQLEDGSLPLLAPMSEVAGRIGVLMAAQLFLKYNGGTGLLPGGVPGVDKARFTVIGAGTAGQAAIHYAVGMGADVTVLDISLPRLKALEDQYQSRIRTLYSTHQNITRAVTCEDAVISTVLIPGAKAPKLVTEEMVKAMKTGSVIIDIAIDQGGSVETVDHATTHDQPTYIRHGVIHYAVANMPGAAPRTSTFALANATMPYVKLLAEHGIGACEINKPLDHGLVRSK